MIIYWQVESWFQKSWPTEVEVMAKAKMTEVEAAAHCLFEAIQGAETFGKAQADKVGEQAQQLLKDGEIDVAMFAAIINRFGNHSATRQRLEKYGWFARKVQADALETAMRKIESEVTAPENQ
jgi:hypothetical protein